MSLSVQLTDLQIDDEQPRSRLVQKMREAAAYRGMKVKHQLGLTQIEKSAGWYVVLPPGLWAIAFKESHDSVWAGYLRAPHTYARIVQVNWWSGLQHEVKQWVRGCQEYGSPNARPREVVPPLQSL
jgi:hypothetical protein